MSYVPCVSKEFIFWSNLLQTCLLKSKKILLNNEDKLRIKNKWEENYFLDFKSRVTSQGGKKFYEPDKIKSLPNNC